MTTAQINACPRCKAHYAIVPSYYEPHCMFCGWTDHAETPPETALERRKWAKARSEVAERYNSTKVSCPQGHPYDDDNTYVDRKGSRRCRVCITPSRTRRWRIAGLGAL